MAELADDDVELTIGKGKVLDIALNLLNGTEVGDARILTRGVEQCRR